MKTHLKLFSIFILFLMVQSCKKEDTTTPTPTPTPVAIKSSAKLITSFSFSALNPAVTGTISGTAISADVPATNDITKLTPTIIISDMAKISPSSGSVVDFSQPVTFTVTAEDGSTQNYTVKVSKQYSTDLLAAYYPFNSNANDESGHNVNGIVNGASLTTDRHGNKTAYSFDGVSNNISFTTIPMDNTDNFSISLWVSVASINQKATFLSNGFDDGTTGDGYSIGMGYDNTTAGKYLNAIYGGVVNLLLNKGFQDADINNWVHIVMVRNNGTAKFYWNGLLNQTITSTQSPKTPTKLTIGSGTTGGKAQRFFKGSLDDIRIYRRVLTDSEIAALAKE